MILGRGTAQTDEAIIAEFCQFLEQVGQIRGAERIKDLKTIPALLRRRIEKPLLQWSDEDILAVYAGKTKNTEYRYSVFLSFLFYRGYHRPSMHLLMSLPLWLHRQWRLAVAPYQKRLEQVTTELGESDVKCLLCDRFAIGKEDLPRLKQMYERFLSLGLTLKAEVVAAQIHRLEAPGEEQPAGFIPTHAITRAARR